VPRFEPFNGLRYDIDRVDLAAVSAPPYDVIDDEQRADLAARDPYNVVHLDLPLDEDGEDRYAVACRILNDWRAKGVLMVDEEPSFYVYRMGYHDEAGRPHQTAGIIGALELSKPGSSDVLPHEHTTPKAKSDRLNMLRSCRANLSPVWGLSLAPGLSGLAELPGPPMARWTDDEGVHHRLWQITEPGIVSAISDTVAAAPVVIADGHHRYQTSLEYRDERRAEAGGAPGPYDLVMTYVVELVEEQLTVRPIHRLISGLPDGFDLVAALEPWFEVFDAGPTSGADTLPARMADAGALALVLPEATWLLRPRPEAIGDVQDLDSSRLDVALAALPGHELRFQHGVDNVVRLVEKGEAQAGVLLRPATVAQIQRNAHENRLMPPKTTFFHPKVKTGLVFRLLD
jgi:uncharacterized protein (DUF1015 family)